MIQGHTYHTEVEISQSPNCDLAACWHTLGGAFAKPQLEKVMEDGKCLSTWCFDITDPLRLPAGDMRFEEFKKAWYSIEASIVDPSAPVAVCRAYRDHYRSLAQNAKIATQEQLATEGVRGQPDTAFVAAWLTIGGSVENLMPTRGATCCVWQLSETAQNGMTRQEAWDCWDSLPWCMANEWHPIAVCRAYRENSRDMRKQAFELAVGVRIRKGNRVAVVYPNSPEWLKKEAAKLL